MTSSIVSLLGRRPADPDLQAGSHGLSVADIVARYFEGPGQVLTLLRAVRALSLEELATQATVPLATLRAYEASEQNVSPQHIVMLSKVLQADLKALLQALGAARPDASEESLGIAALSADDLSDDEKLDLKKLLEAFVAGRDDRSG